MDEIEVTIRRLLHQEADSQAMLHGNGNGNGTTTATTVDLCDQIDGTNAWREKVVHWIYQVVDHFNVDRESVFVAMNILDRFLSVVRRQTCQSVYFPKESSDKNAANAGNTAVSGANEDGNEEAKKNSSLSCALWKSYLTDSQAYEVAVMTSLLIAMKLQGNSTLDIYDFIKMSRSSIQADDMVETGKHIVKCLSWNCQVPTSPRFVHALLQLLHSDSAELTLPLRSHILNSAMYLIELSLFDNYLCQLSPSMLAYIAIENAMDQVSSSNVNVNSPTISEPTRHAFRQSVARIAGYDKVDIVMSNRLLQIYQNSQSDTSSSSSPSQNQQEGQAHVDRQEDFVPIANQYQAPSSTSAPTLIPPDDDDHDALNKHSLLNGSSSQSISASPSAPPTATLSNSPQLPSSHGTTVLDALPETMDSIDSSATAAQCLSNKRRSVSSDDVKCTRTNANKPSTTKTSSFTLTCSNPSKRQRPTI